MAPPGLDWQTYVDTLVRERGSLAAVAAHIAAQRGFADDVGNVERGLRRLRSRGHKDGGVWGRRALAVFGVPSAVVARVRWMGMYHSRFTDLPTTICRDLLAPWNRPPVSESNARVWVHLGLASVALRSRDHERAEAQLDQAARAPSASADARIEHALTRSFLISRKEPERSLALLEGASSSLAEVSDEDTRACLHARLLDQRAYPLNKPTVGGADHDGALALYRQIPDDGPPFARCRRHNGMGWSLFRLGDSRSALAHAKTSVTIAGDSGSLRLRAMALNLLAKVVDSSDAAEDAARRARAIAAQLHDDELVTRYAAGPRS